MSEGRAGGARRGRRAALRTSTDQSFLLTSGERWLCQRSRHCLPERPSICEPMADQRTLMPSASDCSTSACSMSSSSCFHTCLFHMPSDGVPERPVTVSSSGLAGNAAPSRDPGPTPSSASECTSMLSAGRNIGAGV